MVTTEPKERTKPIPAYYELEPDDTPPTNRPRRGRPPGSGSTKRVKADEVLVKKTLFTAFSTASFAFTITGYQRLSLSDPEKLQLAEVWTAVILDYPDLLKWFDQGGKLTNLAQAMIITVSIFFPKVTGVDLNKPVTFSNNGRDNSFARTANQEQTRTPVENNTDQTGGTRIDGGNNGFWQDNPSAIIARD